MRRWWFVWRRIPPGRGWRGIAGIITYAPRADSWKPLLPGRRGCVYASRVPTFWANAAVASVEWLPLCGASDRFAGFRRSEVTTHRSATPGGVAAPNLCPMCRMHHLVPHIAHQPPPSHVPSVVVLSQGWPSGLVPVIVVDTTPQSTYRAGSLHQTSFDLAALSSIHRTMRFSCPSRPAARET